MVNTVHSRTALSVFLLPLALLFLSHGFLKNHPKGLALLRCNTRSKPLSCPATLPMSFLLHGQQKPWAAASCIEEASVVCRLGITHRSLTSSMVTASDNQQSFTSYTVPTGAGLSRKTTQALSVWTKTGNLHLTIKYHFIYKVCFGMLFIYVQSQQLF